MTDESYTKLPNWLIEFMPNMIEAELRVAIAIVRKTNGWHKEEDCLSLTQLQDSTGLTRQGVINGINKGIEHGIIQKTKSGYSFSYKLVNEVDRTSQQNRPEVVNEVDQFDTKLVNEVDTQKKDLKKESLIDQVVCDRVWVAIKGKGLMIPSALRDIVLPVIWRSYLKNNCDENITIEQGKKYYNDYRGRRNKDGAYYRKDQGWVDWWANEEIPDGKSDRGIKQSTDGGGLYV